MPLTFPTGPAEGDTYEYLGQVYRYSVSDDAWRRVHSEYQVISHNHDERYYTETEADALLATKAASGHTHSYLPLSGGTLTGSLTLPGNPVAAFQAATKSYVDTAVSGLGGGGSTGAFSVSIGFDQTQTVSTGVPNSRYLVVSSLNAAPIGVGSTSATGTFTYIYPGNTSPYTLYWVVVG